MKYEYFNTEAREVAGEWLRKHMHVFSEPKKPEIPALDTSEKTYERIRELEIKVAIPILSKRRRLGEAIGLLEMFEERNRDVAPGVRHLIRAARFSMEYEHKALEEAAEKFEVVFSGPQVRTYWSWAERQTRKHESEKERILEDYEKKVKAHQDWLEVQGSYKRIISNIEGTKDFEVKDTINSAPSV